MPLHRFFIPPGLYTAADKAALAEAVTSIYTTPGKALETLPAFYVVVLFIEVKEDYFVGGKNTKNFVRVLVHHLAIQFESGDERKVKFMDMYEDVIRPFTKDRGVDWEVAITDEDPMLWHENGIIPPHALHDKEVEDLWVKENKPIPYEVKFKLNGEGER